MTPDDKAVEYIVFTFDSTFEELRREVVGLLGREPLHERTDSRVLVMAMTTKRP